MSIFFVVNQYELNINIFYDCNNTKICCVQNNFYAAWVLNSVSNSDFWLMDTTSINSHNGFETDLSIRKIKWLGNYNTRQYRYAYLNHTPLVAPTEVKDGPLKTQATTVAPTEVKDDPLKTQATTAATSLASSYSSASTDKRRPSIHFSKAERKLEQPSSWGSEGSMGRS
jgi:hypothetical protein